MYDLSASEKTNETTNLTEYKVYFIYSILHNVVQIKKEEKE